MKKGLRLFIALLILTLVLLPVPAVGDEPQFKVAPENPQFSNWIKEDRATRIFDLGKGWGYFPSPVNRSLLFGTPLPVTDDFPSAFDLRAQNRVTPVKDQGSYGTCWSFATFASLESALTPTETWDFSEDNLVNLHGYDLGYNDGGNYDMATAYLARWSGPVSEADDPYPDHYSPQGLPVSKHVQNVIFLPPRSGAGDNDAIKWALLNYGAVATSMYWSENYYLSSSQAYYYNGSLSSNHAVAIVGWDDNFDRSLFGGSAGQPPGNGAFIVKNSWGTSFGNKGYFFVSYYDSRIGLDLAVFYNAEMTSNFSRVYQYDPLGMTANAGFQFYNSAWFGNLFQALEDSEIKAVSFYIPVPNSYVEIGINVSSPEMAAGEIVYQNVFPYAGYFTFPVYPGYRVSRGQYFSAAVKLVTPFFNYPVPIEAPIERYSSKASASPGQSFVSLDGLQWTDLTSIIPGTNACLKVFTGPISPAPPTLAISPHSFSFQAKEGQSNPPPQFLEVWNSGTGTLNWSLASSYSWLKLNPQSGTNTGMVEVSVDISALGPGRYSDMIVAYADPGQYDFAEVKLTITPSNVVNYSLSIRPGWNQISIPLVMFESPLIVFGSLPEKWFLYQWDPISRKYLTKADISLDPGEGYWLKSTGISSPISYQVSGVPLSEKESSVGLHPGWNMIGFPFLEELNWQETRVRFGGVEYSIEEAANAGIISPYIYWWTGQRYEKVKDLGVFQPGKGYWLKSYKEAEIIFKSAGN